ncbi:MAG: 30S ribosomal protein S4 [Patescibacteria group bacterium]
MGKSLEAKCKQCRRIGEKLFLKGDRCNSPKCAMVKKNYPPGFHGPKGSHRRKSDYGIQLAEKQKAKKQYGLLEKQFNLTFLKAQKQTGESGENLLKLLEMRLDNVIFRLGFAPSRNQARQIVNHGHIKVNNKKINIPSYIVKNNDVIKIRAKSMKQGFAKVLPEKLKNISLPSWLYLEAKELSAKVLHEPKSIDLQTNINTQMIVEYYSR